LILSPVLCTLANFVTPFVAVTVFETAPSDPFKEEQVYNALLLMTLAMGDMPSIGTDNQKIMGEPQYGTYLTWTRDALLRNDIGQLTLVVNEGRATPRRYTITDKAVIVINGKRVGLQQLGTYIGEVRVVCDPNDVRKALRLEVQGEECRQTGYSAPRPPND
jgi:hypothetical protein